MKFKRNVLDQAATQRVAQHLQKTLVDLVDLSLKLKQAHWCVVGSNFRAVHLQLDEIIVSTRDASDDVAERLSTLGIAPDGRATTIATTTRLDNMSGEFEDVPRTVGAVADRLKSISTALRESIHELGELDPISEDLLIAVSAALEKHLWMIQAQEI